MTLIFEPFNVITFRFLASLLGSLGKTYWCNLPKYTADKPATHHTYCSICEKEID
jgi:hypothetical protein